MNAAALSTIKRGHDSADDICSLNKMKSAFSSGLFHGL